MGAMKELRWICNVLNVVAGKNWLQGLNWRANPNLKPVIKIRFFRQKPGCIRAVDGCAENFYSPRNANHFRRIPEAKSRIRYEAESVTSNDGKVVWGLPGWIPSVCWISCQKAAHIHRCNMRSRESCCRQNKAFSNARVAREYCSRLPRFDSFGHPD